ncbi:MAG: LysM peptidoglycan-binding domain-containing protein [Chthoniobacter sp.]|uniref:LysM peptidoglycan-binding domain-containing protein n=1 Tax=Chthoniobacter sp. TaxID=2510640 RepID=UPI0032A15D58
MRNSRVGIVTVVALSIGFAAGYFSYIVRFPLRHERPELFTAAAAQRPPPPPNPIDAEVEKARKLQAAGKLVEAQTLLEDQLHIYPQAPATHDARELLGEINTELFFSRDDLYGKTEYTVGRGDSLARIARQLNSSPEMIMRANALDSTVIHPGERLLVPDGDFTVTIDLPKQRVVVHHGNGFFKQYPIQSINLPRAGQTRITTKVTATTFWKDGARVLPSADHAEGATPWVHFARPGCILYGVSEEDGVENGAVEVAESEAASGATATTPAATPTPNPDVPPYGIAMFKDDLAELQLLLRRGTPVTIVREDK